MAAFSAAEERLRARFFPGCLTLGLALGLALGPLALALPLSFAMLMFVREDRSWGSGLR